MVKKKPVRRKKPASREALAFAALSKVVDAAKKGEPWAVRTWLKVYGSPYPTKVAELEATMGAVRNDRDLWKAKYNEALAEVSQLKKVAEAFRGCSVTGVQEVERLITERDQFKVSHHAAQALNIELVTNRDYWKKLAEATSAHAENNINIDCSCGRRFVVGWP